MGTDDMANGNCIRLGIKVSSYVLVKGPMKERPGSHFKLMFMAGQMMLRHLFPLERCYPIATFPRLSLQTAPYKDIKANLLGK